MAQIYRKTALDKISSPEQLDKSLKITSPLSWLALIGLTLIVVVAVIWSVVGRIPETITLQGVLAEPNGVCSVFATESGKVVEITIDGNDPVSIGTPIMLFKAVDEEEKTLLSDQAGTVYRILKDSKSDFLPGEEILRISPAVTNKELVAVCYATQEEAKKIRDKLAEGVNEK